MDSITIASNILTYAQIILFLVLSVAAVYLIRLIIDLSKLAKNLDETTTMVKQELEPTIDELKTTLKNLNLLASATDRQFDNARKIVGKVANIAGLVLGQFKHLSGGFTKGLIAGIELFSKKK